MMKATLEILNSKYTIDLDSPLSIGIPLNPFEDGPSCFYADQPSAAPVTSGDFIGSIDAGAPVNFYQLQITPHGNGTHTECIGHISDKFEKVNTVIKNPFYLAELISITPENNDDDLVITEQLLKNHIKHHTQALIIRTIPNEGDKKHRNYTETNPPYLTAAAMQYIVGRGFQHLLLDLPSVDKEKDEGAVAAHKIFWDLAGNYNTKKTITEMIFVSDDIVDGVFILNLRVSNIALDAVPSEPVLYRAGKIENRE